MNCKFEDCRCGNQLRCAWMWMTFIALIAIVFILASCSSATASERWVKAEEVYSTKWHYKTEQRCTTSEGDALGGLIIGGLIGSAVGNQASSSDGAGALGTFLGAVIGAENAKPKQTCETIQVPAYSTETLKGWNITIDGRRYWIAK